MSEVVDFKPPEPEPTKTDEVETPPGRPKLVPNKMMVFSGAVIAILPPLGVGEIGFEFLRLIAAPSDEIALKAIKFAANCTMMVHDQMSAAVQAQMQKLGKELESGKLLDANGKPMQ